MKQSNRTTQSIACLIGCWFISSAIAGCAKPTAQQRSETTPSTSAPVTASASTSTKAATPKMPGEQQWASLLQGGSAQGLTFTTGGQLLYQDEVLLKQIPVSYSSTGDVTYAQRLLVSDPSPSDRFDVVKACESPTNESGLCWSVFLVDRQLKTAQKVDVAKYGGQDWVQWSADERYAVLAESTEGVTFFVALDLQTSKSRMFEQTSATADLSSFRWIDNRTFQVNLVCGDQSNCTEPSFRGDITTLFNQ